MTDRKEYDDSRARFNRALLNLRYPDDLTSAVVDASHMAVLNHEKSLTDALKEKEMLLGQALEVAKQWMGGFSRQEREIEKPEQRTALDATTIKAWVKENERLRTRKVELEMWWASLSSPAPQYHELAAAWAAWADSVWGDRTGQPQGTLNHLKEEVQELINAPFDAAEYADCFALLVDAARMADIPPEKLLLAVEAKLEVNKKRDWGPVDADGVSHHIKPECKDD